MFDLATLRRGERAPAGSFRLWAWTLLLVVLLSAAPTGGQIQLRAVGSAFDPAASAVAVGPKRARLDTVAAKAARADDERPDARDAPALAVVQLPTGRSAIFGSTVAGDLTPVSYVSPPARLLAVRYPARAPPLA